jgi:hypothetical protein
MTAEKYRASWLTVEQAFSLDDACRVINAAFRDSGFGTFHVGSSLSHRDYHDVDVRYILEDKEFDRLFGEVTFDSRSELALKFLNAAISCWIRQRTGLPIDFQFQGQTKANAEHGGKRRNAIGMPLTA